MRALIGVFLIVSVKKRQVFHCHVNICYGYQPTAIESVSDSTSWKRVGGVEVGIGVKFVRVREEASKFLMIITSHSLLE